MIMMIMKEKVKNKVTQINLILKILIRKDSHPVIITTEVKEAMIKSMRMIIKIRDLRVIKEPNNLEILNN